MSKGCPKNHFPPFVSTPTSLLACLRQSPGRHSEAVRAIPALNLPSPPASWPDQWVLQCQAWVEPGDPVGEQVREGPLPIPQLWGYLPDPPLIGQPCRSPPFPDYMSLQSPSPREVISDAFPHCLGLRPVRSTVGTARPVSTLLPSTKMGFGSFLSPRGPFQGLTFSTACPFWNLQ